MEEVKMLEQESVVKQAQQDLRDLEENKVVDLTNSTDEQAAEKMKPKQLVRKHAKIGRNEPRPGGSGKKFKKCCMNTGEFDGLREI